jgi:hypothetical protein
VASSSNNTGTIALPSRAGKAAPHAGGRPVNLFVNCIVKAPKVKAKLAQKIGPDSDNGFHLNDR